MVTSWPAQGVCHAASMRKVTQVTVHLGARGCRPFGHGSRSESQQKQAESYVASEPLRCRRQRIYQPPTLVERSDLVPDADYSVA